MENTDSGTLKFSNPSVKEETKHTPGPWEVNHGPKTIDSDHRFVEIHSITGGKTGDGNVIAVVLADSFNHTVPFTYEAKANAELIASAPDLLKENQELKALSDGFRDDMVALNHRVLQLMSINAELLEALEDIMKIKSNFDNSGWYNTQWIKAQSAINKAKAQ